MSIKSVTRGVPVILQDAATDGDGIVLAIPNSFHSHKLSAVFTALVSAGEYQPESADTFDYAGTWNPLGGGTIAFDADSELDYNFEGVYQFIRARITTPLVGGTVTITYIGS